MWQSQGSLPRSGLESPRADEVIDRYKKGWGCNSVVALGLISSTKKKKTKGKIAF
jgi:hypothetical protein